MVQTVNHEELERKIEQCFNSNPKIPLFVYGPPGIGKSDTIKSFGVKKADELGKKFVEWSDVTTNEQNSGIDKDVLLDSPREYFLLVDKRLSQNDPTNIRGIPDTDGEVTAWNPPEWLDYVCSEGASGIVFCDELTHAPQSVQKSYFSLIGDRKVDNNRLADDVYVAAAGNREGDRAGTISMPSPLNNRLGHVELVEPRGGKDGDWVDWAMENDVHESIVAFISSNVGSRCLFKFEEGNRDKRAFPTPRSWEMASDVIKSSEVESPEEIASIAEMFVGDVASEFHGFLNHRENLDIERYLQNPEETEGIMQNESVDLKYAFVSAVAQEYRSNPDRLSDIIQILNHIDDKEFGSYMIIRLKNINPDHFDENAMDCDGFVDVASDLYKFFTN